MTPAGLVGIALAHGLAIAITVAATANISGGHVNPAVTFGLVIGGNITLVTGLLYWIGQLLGSIAASLVLKFVIVSTEVYISTPNSLFRKLIQCDSRVCSGTSTLEK